MASQHSIVAPPADWYLDPLNRHEHRYWDGLQWTHHVSDSGQTSVDPVLGPAAQAASGPWSRVPATKPVARRGHTATLLADGTVLVVGGSDGYGDDINVFDVLNSAVTYDPATGVWTDAGKMATARKDHAATLLADGRVLVTGGFGRVLFGDHNERLASTEADNPARKNWRFELASLTSAELYDPASRIWQPAASMKVARFGGAVLLNDGRVLVCQAPAEIYDPASGTWSNADSMCSRGHGNHMILLKDGRVLVGGLTSAEVYEPATGTWSSAGTMHSERNAYTMTSLNDGRVLVAGGIPRPRVPRPAGSEGPAAAELYDPISGTWSVAPAMTDSRSGHAATLLADGRVLISGGSDFSAPGKVIPTHDSSELYDPSTGTWTAMSPMKEQRYGHTATRLADGRVLVAGGILREQDPDGRRAAEMFDPASVCGPPSDAVSAPIVRAGSEHRQ